MMTQEEIISVVEAMLFATDEPLGIVRIRRVIKQVLKERLMPPILADEAPILQVAASGQSDADDGEQEQTEIDEQIETQEEQQVGRHGENLDFDSMIETAILAIKQKYSDDYSPVVVLEIADGWQFATNPRLSPYVRKLYKERTHIRLSQAALETLTIVAYKQPITRAEIEHIRGVESIAALETLIERNLLRVDGRKETVGRPLLYATPPEFLRQIGLKAIDELPALEAGVTDVTPPAQEPRQEARVPKDAPVVDPELLIEAEDGQISQN